MTDLDPLPAPASVAATGWQALPERARLLFILQRVLPTTLPGLAAGGMLFRALDWPFAAGGVAGLLVGLVFGVWLGMRQFQHVAWCLDEDGLAIRRGRLWQRETRVPATRVQHLDLTRGPWQRRRNLATLVVHTAGTRHSSVTVPHLDADDAQRLRDVLGRQIDHDDDA